MRILALVSGLMVAAIMFIGCTIDMHDNPSITDGTEGQGEEGQGEEGQGEEEKQEQEQDLIVNKDPNLAVKFGVIDAGAVTRKADVTETLKKIHEHLESHPDAEGIALGDFIELPELNVAGYPDNDGEDDGKIDGLAKAHILVVGINSFNKLPWNNTPHLVFQFENALVARKMLGASSSKYSYIGSGMQTYLQENFYDGLKNAAGVDNQYFFEPSRRVAESWNGSAVEVKDPVWLPTEWEMFGEKKNAPTVEDTGNQVWLEYYNTGSETTDAQHRTKLLSSTALTYWWLASPHADSYAKYACSVSANGEPDTANAVATSAELLGFAPAFCIN
jgi:hypothetical protein